MSPSRGSNPSAESDIPIADPILPTSTTSSANQRTSPASSHFLLPPGCSYDNSLSKSPDTTQVIWVDFPPNSLENPFYFSRSRKNVIICLATFYTGITAFSASAYAIGVGSMCEDLGCSRLESATGLGLYAWGFAVAPLALAPLSEEFGRKWTYFTAVFIFFIFHLSIALAKNIETILVCRFIMGNAGSVGSTLVGGTISDIYHPEHRGLPMSILALTAFVGTGLGPVTMSWVEANPRLEWRWIQWIQFIILGAYLPLAIIGLRETRAPVILRRRARKLRKERGLKDGGRYMARSEVGKLSFWIAMRQSLSRPLSAYAVGRKEEAKEVAFLLFEPIVTFFSLWIGLGWGVLYSQIGGLAYVFGTVYGFDITQTGLVYLTIVLGGFLAFFGNFIQDAVYRRKVAKRGIEARLCAPMIAGVGFAIGCFIFGFSSLRTVHWIVPCIGLTILLTGILTIFISCFTYLSECYGSYASSAIAGQSLTRNIFGGAFSLFTEQMYVNLTPRWATFIFGCLAAALALVPFVAFYKGPQIRARSKYSRELMKEERERIQSEQSAHLGGEEGKLERAMAGREEVPVPVKEKG